MEKITFQKIFFPKKSKSEKNEILEKTHFQLKFHLKSIFQKSILNDISKKYFFGNFQNIFLHEKIFFSDDFFFKVHLLDLSFPTHPTRAPGSVWEWTDIRNNSQTPPSARSSNHRLHNYTMVKIENLSRLMPTTDPTRAPTTSPLRYNAMYVPEQPYSTQWLNGLGLSA